MKLNDVTKAAIMLNAERAATLALTVGVVGAATIGAAHAGTDTTFSSTATNLSTYMSGSLGKLAALGSLAFGVIGAIARFDWKLIAGGVGVGMAASTGPAIVQSFMTATF